MKWVTDPSGEREVAPRVEGPVGGVIGAVPKGLVTLRITFYGVRGSTPCCCESNQRVGGNTACVVVEGDGFDPLVLDLGTGLRFWGVDVLAAQSAPLRATALVSHLHWDHVQGLPFFPPIHQPGTEMHIIGPPQQGGSLEEVFKAFLCPPVFPVGLDDLVGIITFAEAGSEPIVHGTATITARDVPHVGPTVGYRIDHGGRSIAYISDHQQPGAGSTSVAEDVIALCDGVDVLIHDAQYTPAEFDERSDWGHCTLDYALEVAVQSRVKALALFHHDPGHDDAMIDRLTSELVGRSPEGGPRIFTASEGLVVDV